MTNKETTIKNLQALIDHPATPENEREAARLALKRLNPPLPASAARFGQMFKNSIGRKSYSPQSVRTRTNDWE